MQSPERRRLQSLDYARFIAAVSVLIFHYFFNGIVGGKIENLSFIPVWSDIAKYGYLGVNFFFLISGYVIFFSAKDRTAREFAVSRAVRIYPAFVVAVAITSLVAQFWGGPLMSVTVPQALVNLTFYPGLFGVGFVDGVYWTLQLEVQFYSLVLVILMAGWGSRLEWFFISWPAVMLAGLILGVQQFPFLGGYYSYFAAGALFGIVGRQATLAAVVALALACALCVVQAVGEAEALSEAKDFDFSPTIVVAACVVMFGFFASLRGPVGRLSLPGSRLLGGLTYPLYLIHAHVGYMILSRFHEDHMAAYVGAISATLSLALLIHLGVERAGARLWPAVMNATVGSIVSYLSRKPPSRVPTD